MINYKVVCFSLVLSLLSALFTAKADVVAASADHYTLKHQAVSADSPQQVWARLVEPQTWWHPDHTYSGSSDNLSLDSSAGCLWLEQWEGGSVVHGSVLLARPGEMLRLNAPFGPLQEMAVSVIWTISLEATPEGTRVTFTEIANGSQASDLDKLAPAVDFVKQEAITRLTKAASVE